MNKKLKRNKKEGTAISAEVEEKEKWGVGEDSKEQEIFELDFGKQVNFTSTEKPKVTVA